MRLACIGIGSNAIRLLEAQWEQEGLCAVRRERRGTRLFAGLVDGKLTEQSIQSSVDAVAELAMLARRDGAQEIFVFATSAVRDALNGEDFVLAAQEASGTHIDIITGEEEAVLSYIGASNGGRCGVIDIGGGSTEFTIGEGHDVLGAVSLQMGAVRMNGQTPIFCREDYEETVERCIHLIRRDAQSLLNLPRAKNWAGVGGTMTTIGAMQRGVIYGFVDYFPGFAPFSYVRGSDGMMHETENYLVVANLSQIQSSWGVLPYQIWIKNRDDSGYLYEFIEEQGMRLNSLKDSSAMLVEIKNDPVLQGTNGILTVGFIVVLLLCSVGFLIYWILSIKSRSLQFGIFRAMGMSMREVLSMLVNEQVFISGSAIAVGALVGNLASRLYMPLIQLAYAASDNALPLEVVNLPADNVRLFAVIGAMMLLCMVVLGAMISRLKIAQALKLGED